MGFNITTIPNHPDINAIKIYLFIFSLIKITANIDINIGYVY